MPTTHRQSTKDVKTTQRTEQEESQITGQTNPLRAKFSRNLKRPSEYPNKTLNLHLQQIPPNLQPPKSRSRNEAEELNLDGIVRNKLLNHG